MRRIRSALHAGSLRFSYALGIPELRAITTQRFPSVVFDVPDGQTVDIWRVLHSRRDVPATLADEG